jgi:hypothetical protein
MEKQAKPAPRLPLNSCEDLLEKVKWDRQQLNADWGTYKTLDFILSANHLYKDWIDKTGSNEQRQRKWRAGKSLKDIFHCLGDLANATKHWKLDKYNQENQIVDAVSTPIIADWSAYFLTGPVIYVDILGSRLSMPELTDITLKCLDWLVHGSTELDAENLDREIDQLFQNTKVST